MFRVTKDMIMGDILAEDMSIGYVLMHAGLHCFSCGSAQNESLEEACLVHGLDPDGLTDQINDFLEFKEANDFS